MKKLLLIASLLGVIVTGAFAQGLGTQTQTSTVTVTVATYMNLSAISVSNFTFAVSDGGFSATYPSSGAGTFTLTSNVACTLHASVGATTPTSYTIFTKLDSGSFVASATAPGVVGKLVPHTIDVQLQNVAAAGLTPDAGSTGTLTLTVTTP